MTYRERDSEEHNIKTALNSRNKLMLRYAIHLFPFKTNAN